MREAEAARGPAQRADPVEEITRLARSGEKIEAIKLYREVYDAGLAESKDAVEAIVRGDAQATTGAPVVAATEELNAEIKALIAKNKRIEAIKLYRETYDVGLKEAKDAVDAMR